MKVLACFYSLFAIPSVLYAETLLLDFTADWCAPCRTMAPVVAGLEKEGYRIERIDVDRDRAKAISYGVRNIPTFISLKDGREVGRLVGMVRAGQLRDLLGPPVIDGRSAVGPGVTRAASESATTTTRPFGKKLIQSSARLTAENPGSRTFATGTVIRSVPGETLVLTCAHLFSDHPTSSRIVVEFFGTSTPTRFHGEAIASDRRADVALVRVRTNQVFPTAIVATQRPSRGMGATSVGCSHGRDPDVWNMRVADVNRYLDAPTIECTRQPVQGRSGGGLFNASGKLVGVCSAADPSLRRGIYAGLEAVHALLDRQGLASVYRRSSTQEIPIAAAGREKRRITLPPPKAIGLNVGTDLLLSEDAADAEMVFILRPRNTHDGRSRVVILNRVSPELLKLIRREQTEQEQRSIASLRFSDEVHSTGAKRSAKSVSATMAMSEQKKLTQWKPISQR